MPRFFIRLSYKGTKYNGWQIQPSAPTVQRELEKALAVLWRECIPVTGGARTDTGVHAINYIAHFDARSPGDDPDKLKRNLNGVLPSDISVQGIYEVGESRHARFDAVSRTYHYVITTHKDPFLKEFSYRIHRDPDLEAMNRACIILKEQKDFTSFGKLHGNNTTNLCSISDAAWYEKDGNIIFRITSDRFLRGMVRAIVGTMLETGFGKMKEGEFERIFTSKNRAEAGMSVPASGLFFTGIRYMPGIVPEENLEKLPFI